MGASVSGAKARLCVGAAALLLALRLLLAPAYHSTDFEVHRNWLAITYSLPAADWYYENTSQWTLDYPPFFAWFEFALSQIARLFDPQMLVLTNLNYASANTVLFQRLSVVFTDLILALGAKRCCDSLLDSKSKFLVFLLVFGNIGLLMVDHIHFQYNGILFGIMLLSVGEAMKNNHLLSAFWFAVLLNMKHIYLYIAPAYVVYLFRSYCFTVSSRDSVNVAWYSFSLKNLVKLGFTVISVFVVSFGPFYKHIPQVLSRLFPFKRGLTHAYWAPNFWALYNVADKVAVFLYSKFGYKTSFITGSMTSGLVQEYSHSILPSVTPFVTFLLTFLTMIPALIKLWKLGADKKRRHFHFIRCITICAACSFMFGWHVHEKAILIVIIPLSLLAALDPYDCRVFLILSTVGHYSLFPLLYSSNLFPVKVTMLSLHTAIAFYQLPSLYACKKPAAGKSKRLPMLNFLETLYIVGLVPLCAYDNIVHNSLNLHKTYPFLPLLMTSVYCAVGVLYCWSRLYGNFMSMTVSDADVKMPKKVK
ncbi:ALG6/ALG8 family glucosyltransferase xit [Arctopsyche grandis]|uniref:ALG6/ALG8 family glucosyltransferase xit n=1 Tax=Arctopsyche grandis TaxID=121162 RepID=UPI00406D653B